MKRILYFDCFSGISGDMTLGALMDLGLDPAKVTAELQKLHVDGYELVVNKKEMHSILGTDVDVRLDNTAVIHDHECEHQAAHEHAHAHSHQSNHTHESLHGHGHVNQHEHAHTHQHEHAHTHQHEHAHLHQHDHAHLHQHCHSHQFHRNLHDITRIIQDSDLSSAVKSRALSIFTEIAKSEAAVHGKSIAEVHFHEVGAVDSIVDIVGTAICLDMLQVDEIHCSVVTEGHGFIECQHGTLPVPVPAVAKMMENCEVLLQQGSTAGELVTPTGFAILKATAASCGAMPPMKIMQIGYGFGKRDTGTFNALRVYLGAAQKQSIPTPPLDQQAGQNWDMDTIMVLECTLDDERGEIIGYTIERLLTQGALDAYSSPIHMKKSRPATLLTVLCKNLQLKKLASILFEETSTIGLRYYPADRFLLQRTTEQVNTELGQLSVKISGSGASKKVKPEYEDCAALARKHGIPLRKIYELLK